MSNAFWFNRGQLLHCIPQDVERITVQPSSHNGDVFAATSTATFKAGVLRIFDIRCSTTGT